MKGRIKFQGQESARLSKEKYEETINLWQKELEISREIGDIKDESEALGKLVLCQA